MQVRKLLPGFLAFLLALLLLQLGYFTPRNNFELYFAAHAAAFGLYALLLKVLFRAQKINIFYWLIVAVLLRVLLLGMLPNLSDDYYRFVWDGRLWTHGINPFAHTPEALIQQPLADSLHLDFLYWGDPEQDWSYFEGLNSKIYYSVYPSVNQLCFGFATWLFPQNTWASIIIMKIILLIAETGTLFLSLRLLKHLNINKKHILWYAFNPLIIYDVFGNIHFELIAIFFLILSLYLLLNSRLIYSAMAFSGAVLTKLIPILFLPLIFGYLGWRKGLFYSLLVVSLSFLGLLPFFPDLTLFIQMGKSVQLYFASFEFNASFYYLSKWISSFYYEYPPSSSIVLILTGITLLSIFYLTFIRPAKTISQLILWILVVMSVYLLMTRTIHPWYLSTLLILSIFTPYRSAFLWSFLVVLGNVAYSHPDFSENHGLILLEYGLLFTFLIWDVRPVTQKD